MSIYQQVLDLAREQSEALRRGELESATALLEHRAALLVHASAPGPQEVGLVHEILRLDRDLSSAIRERMIKIRDEALESSHGRRALDGYARRTQRRPLAIDRQS
jgi:hypothetical protein